LTLGQGAGEAKAPAAKAEEPPEKPELREQPSAAADVAEQPAVAEHDLAQPTAAAKAGFPPPAAPTIRKLAKDLGIDLTKVQGSQHGGRIILQDVRAYIQRLQQIAFQQRKPQPQKPAAEPVDFAKWGPVSAKPMSQLRQVISRRMAESWTTIPHVTQFDSADITVINELRKKYAPDYESKGARLTVTSFVLKTVAAQLKKHPVFNASLEEAVQSIVFKEYLHIGIAVDTDAGLVVPVIRDVDTKSITQLSKDLQDIAEKARDRKLSLEEMRGGTFTISNQGGIGSAHFTPIINKPEAAILGLGRAALKPAVHNGQVVPRLMLPLALSYDHRLIDGAQAARFMADLVTALEQFREEDVRI
jgi:pyruvate dehydrogenase E2 component (dihydrolipoamide acetyltransferase)